MHYDEENQIDSEIAKMFAIDSRDKKIIARGIHNRASRKSGLKHAVAFPYEYLPAKEKKEYMKGGEVVTTSLLDKYKTINDVPSIKEIESMDFNTAKQLLTKIRTFAKVQELADYWGINKKSVYTKLLNRYGVQRREYNNKNNVTVDKAKEIEEYNNNVYLRQMQNAMQIQNIIQPVKPEIPSEGYTINLKGTYTETDFVRRISSMMLMFTDDKKYHINLNIKEIIEG